MKSHQSYLLALFALVVLAPLTHAQNEMKFRHLDGDLPHREGSSDEDRIEKEKVAFLGIETSSAGRTLDAQLGLARDTGLVVTRVLENSPAASVLKEDDVLTKFDDQLLINMQQLGVLVRSKKEGDEIKLTVIRAGKEILLKAKLTSRDVPKLADAGFQRHNETWGDFDRLRDLPGMSPDGARDVMRMIEHERGNFMTGPRMHIVGHAGRGATVVDLPNSNVFYSDDEGSIEIKADDGNRKLVVKNPKGEVNFTGNINTVEEQNQLRPEIRQRLQKLETDRMSSEVNGDFQPEVIPFPPEAGATKIIRKSVWEQNNPSDQKMSF